MNNFLKPSIAIAVLILTQVVGQETKAQSGQAQSKQQIASYYNQHATVEDIRASLASSRKQVYIRTPALFDKRIRQSLMEIASRGVIVKILIDPRTVSAMNDLLHTRNVYTKTFLPNKGNSQIYGVAVIDDSKYIASPLLAGVAGQGHSLIINEASATQMLGQEIKREFEYKKQ